MLGEINLLIRNTTDIYLLTKSQSKYNHPSADLNMYFSNSKIKYKTQNFSKSGYLLEKLPDVRIKMDCIFGISKKKSDLKIGITIFGTLHFADL